MISLTHQAEACELEALNIRGWLDTVTQPGRRPRTAEEIRLREMAAERLEAACASLRWVAEREAMIKQRSAA